MATIDKSDRQERARAHNHNGHSSQEAGTPKSAATSAQPGGSSPTRQTNFHRVVRAGRELPRRIEAELKSNPVGMMAAVGAGSFVLGALLGSKLGRLALAAA